MCCSFVRHATRGAAAAVALVSWGDQPGLLQLAVLLQPLQSALPLQAQPNLQSWQSRDFDVAAWPDEDSPGMMPWWHSIAATSPAAVHTQPLIAAEDHPSSTDSPAFWSRIHIVVSIPAVNASRRTLGFNLPMRRMCCKQN